MNNRFHVACYIYKSTILNGQLTRVLIPKVEHTTLVNDRMEGDSRIPQEGERVSLGIHVNLAYNPASGAGWLL